MSVKLPQYADACLKLTHLKSSIDPSSIDLNDVEEIELVICFGNIKNTPVFTVKYTEHPENFDIDDINETITIRFRSSDIGTTLGVYFFNLWITDSNRFLTHFLEKFQLVGAILHD